MRLILNNSEKQIVYSALPCSFLLKTNGEMLLNAHQLSIPFFPSHMQESLYLLTLKYKVVRMKVQQVVPLES